MDDGYILSLCLGIICLSFHALSLKPHFLLFPPSRSLSPAPLPPLLLSGKALPCSWIKEKPFSDSSSSKRSREQSQREDSGLNGTRHGDWVEFVVQRVEEGSSFVLPVNEENRSYFLRIARIHECVLRFLL